MPLESGNHIGDLVITNPPGTDLLSESDDHHRLIKRCLRGSFPNAGSEVLDSTFDEIDAIVQAGAPQSAVYSYYLTPGVDTHTFLSASKSAKIIVVGGGGGGGGGRSGGGHSGGGGGGGAYAELYIPDLSVILAAVDMVIGAKGTGGAPEVDGIDGGLSSWTDTVNTLTCGGGVRGIGAVSKNEHGGDGGVAAGSYTFKANGGKGGYGGFANTGGESPLGVFGTGGVVADVGQDADGLGAGGGGGDGQQTTEIETGTDGAPGGIIVAEWG